MTTYKYYFNSVVVVVNDLTTYHIVVQLYMLLTFKCINNIRSYFINKLRDELTQESIDI